MIHHRWPEMMTASIGVLGSAGVMVYADLPEGPSIVPLLVGVALMSSVTGLVAGVGMAARGARRVIGALIVGEVVGIMAIVLVSMRPLDSLEQVGGGLSLAASFLAAPAALTSLAVGWVSIEVGGRGRRFLLRRAPG